MPPKPVKSKQKPAPTPEVRRPFEHIGILHHPKKPESLLLAERIEGYLRSLGIAHIWRQSAWDTESLLANVNDADLLITLGGDGTLLRAARIGAPHSTPMLGVKMGRLGFLAEVIPEQWQEPIDRILHGDYWIEERLMLRARVERMRSAGGGEDDGKSDGKTDGKTDRALTGERYVLCEYDALNDVVFSRGDLARVIRVSAQLDGGYLTQYTCDGLIVCTATGSTGYALAVGGPILPPELRNILLIPIAPHLSMDRAVVLSEGAEVRLRAYADYRPILTVDGQVVVEMEEGDEVVVVSSPHMARFVRVRDRSYFYQSLMDKLQWTV